MILFRVNYFFKTKNKVAVHCYRSLLGSKLVFCCLFMQTDVTQISCNHFLKLMSSTFSHANHFDFVTPLLCGTKPYQEWIDFQPPRW